MNKTFTQFTRLAAVAGIVALSSAMSAGQSKAATANEYAMAVAQNETSGVHDINQDNRTSVSDVSTVIDQTFEYSTNADIENPVADAPLRGAASTSATPGFKGALSDKTITVSATAGSAFCAFQFDITGVSDAKATAVALTNALTASGYSFQVAYNTLVASTGNTIRVIAYNLSNASFTAPAETAVATITLDKAPTGTLAFSNALCVSADDVTKDVVATKNDITKGLKGDVNKSGTVTTSDISSLLDILFERQSYIDHPENYDINSADINGKDGITVADLSLLLNIIFER